MSTAVVAVAGIVGTLLAALIAGRQARETQRAGEHDRHRIEVYSELLVLAYQLLEQLDIIVMAPNEEATGVSNDAIKRCHAKIELLGTEPVRSASDDMAKAFAAFWRDQFLLGLKYRDPPVGAADTQERIQARMQLAGLLDAARASVRALEEAMRKELRS